VSERYILDACALIAVLAKEEGADKVAAIYKKAMRGASTLIMHKLNLLEVYYGLYRQRGKEYATEIIDKIKMEITIIHEISDEVFAEAGRLKASYKISLADSVALAAASVSGSFLMTADHHEFDAVERAEKIKFLWIR
jgi:predicted nucleic acid-binding protein